MADPITGLALGTVLGGGKYLGDVAGNSNDRAVAAATARYSPWTHAKIPEVRKANFLGDVGSGALTGLATAGAAKAMGLFGGLNGAASEGAEALKGIGAEAGAAPSIGESTAQGALGQVGAMGDGGIGPWAAGYGNPLMQPQGSSISSWLAAMNAGR